MLLDSLLIIGVLTTLLSGVELLLRPYQRQQVQDFLETLTLQSTDILPDDFVSRIKEPSVQAVLIMLTYFELAVMVLVNLFVQLCLVRIGWVPNTLLLSSELKAATLIILLLSISTLIFAWKWPLPLLMSWILGGQTRWSIRIRLGSIVVLGMSVLGTYISLIAWLVANNSLFGINEHLRIWSMVLVMPVFIIFWVLTQGAALALQARSWTARALFGLFKATIWRIVEYNKGAVAGIALATTIVLSILKAIAT